MAFAPSSLAHLEREARRGVQLAAQRFDEAIGRGPAGDAVKAELKRALVRAKDAGVEDRFLKKICKNAQEQLPAGDGDGPLDWLSRDGEDGFPAEAVLTLVSGKSVRIPVTSCQSVSSLRDAAAPHFACHPSRLKLSVGFRVLEENNSSLLACGLPSDGKITVWITGEDSDREAYYRAVEQGSASNESQRRHFADAIQGIIKNSESDLKMRYISEDDRRIVVEKSAANLEQMRARIQVHEERARTTAEDLRSYRPPQARPAMRRV